MEELSYDYDMSHVKHDIYKRLAKSDVDKVLNVFWLLRCKLKYFQLGANWNETYYICTALDHLYERKIINFPMVDLMRSIIEDLKPQYSPWTDVLSDFTKHKYWVGGICWWHSFDERMPIFKRIVIIRQKKKLLKAMERLIRNYYEGIEKN